MDFAILSRRLSIQFSLACQQEVTAEIVLEASLDDLAGEILEISGKQPGCSLSLKFYKRVQHVREQCGKIEQALYAIWENDIQLTQTLGFTFGEEPAGYNNVIEVTFKPKLNEENMGELPEFLDHVLGTLEELNKI